MCNLFASCFKQISTSAPHHSIFTGWMLFQQRESTEGNFCFEIKGRTKQRSANCEALCLPWNNT